MILQPVLARIGELLQHRKHAGCLRPPGRIMEEIHTGERDRPARRASEESCMCKEGEEIRSFRARCFKPVQQGQGLRGS